MSKFTQQLSSEHPLPSPDALIAIHGQICDEFGRLEQLRSTQLASVPAATVLLGGASVFIGTLGATPKSNMFTAFTNFVLALGILGMFTTFGLYFREVEMEVESDDVASQGRNYEDFLKIPNTIFSHPNAHKVFNKTNSALLIYASSFTAWFCVATWFVFKGVAIFLALPVLVVIMLVQERVHKAWLIRRPQLQQLSVQV